MMSNTIFHYIYPGRSESSINTCSSQAHLQKRTKQIPQSNTQEERGIELVSICFGSPCYGLSAVLCEPTSTNNHVSVTENRTRHGSLGDISPGFGARVGLHGN